MDEQQQRERIRQAVAAWLERRNLTVNAASQRWGLDRNTLTRFANGNAPSVDWVEKFARRVGEDVNAWREVIGYERIESPHRLADPTYEHLLNHTVQAYGGGPIPPEDLEVLEAILRDRAAARERKRG